MKQSFEVILKDFAASVVIERDIETSNVCVNWYNIIDGKKILRRRNCEEKMTEQEFIRYKNFLRNFNEIVE